MESKVPAPLIISSFKTEPYIFTSSAIPQGSKGIFNNINFSLWQE